MSDFIFFNVFVFFFQLGCALSMFLLVSVEVFPQSQFCFWWFWSLVIFLKENEEAEDEVQTNINDPFLDVND